MLPRTRFLNFGRVFARQARNVSSSSSRVALKTPKLTLVGSSTIAALVWAMPSAGCAEEDSTIEENNEDGNMKPDEMERFINYTILPACNRLGFGGVMGFCSGIAVKKISQQVAYLIGIGFIGLQIAQHQGYINIDWFKLKDEGTCVSLLFFIILIFCL